MPRPRATRRKASASTDRRARIMRAAISHGKANAVETMRRRGRTLAGGTAGGSGLLIAEGDSWFDYPFNDVLGKLEDDFGYRVESVAHKGDTVEAMAYDQTQLTKLRRAFDHVQQDGRVPRAILLSGGGNDIAGTEFGVLLNHAASRLEPLNPRVVEGVLDDRLRFAIGSLISAVTELSTQHFGTRTPILIHGYGNPVPDGRGFLGGFFILPGPWLKPGFVEKGYEDLQQCSRIMEDLLGRFNALLKSIAATPGFEHVRYVDLRPVLSNELPRAYKDSWANELHPTEDGYARVAQALDQAINTVAPLAGPRGPQRAPARARPTASRGGSRVRSPKRRRGRRSGARS